MEVIRFTATCRPDGIDTAVELFRRVVEPSRRLPGVVAFDVARDVLDPNTLVVTEVFDDVAARDRQAALPEAGEVMAALPGLLAGPPEAVIYQVASSQRAM